MTSDALAGQPTAFYPGGRSAQRPSTLHPGPQQSPADAVQSLIEASAALDELWAQIPPEAWDRRRTPHEDRLAPTTPHPRPSPIGLMEPRGHRRPIVQRGSVPRRGIGFSRQGLPSRRNHFWAESRSTGTAVGPRGRRRPDHRRRRNHCAPIRQNVSSALTNPQPTPAERVQDLYGHYT